jgi:hypothetical protein
MQQAGFKKDEEGTCVKDVWISSGEKKFAFIEMRTFEEAEKAMGLDGKIIVENRADVYATVCSYT